MDSTYPLTHTLKEIRSPGLKDLVAERFTTIEIFKKAGNDPEFAKEFNRLTGETADPMVGETIEANLRKIPKDPKIMAIYKQIIGAGPLPGSQ